MSDEHFKVLFYPNEILRKKDLEEVRWVEDQHRDDAAKMLRTMKKSKGVGLSSPQVGLPYQVIVLDHDGKSEIVMFNPFILEKSSKRVSGVEGCLSFPKLNKVIKRYEEVIVRYRSLDNIVKVETYSGLQARIIQHEIDHLKGVLLLDR